VDVIPPAVTAAKVTLDVVLVIALATAFDDEPDCGTDVTDEDELHATSALTTSNAPMRSLGWMEMRTDLAS
jgi:hypothetical protein